MSDQIEQDIQAKASSAPRVTPADIDAEIEGETYFTAAQGAYAAAIANDGLTTAYYSPPSLGLLTFCVLVLRNGFTVTGESACASQANFNAEIGRRIARENAIQKVWPLLGFRLRDHLHAHARLGSVFVEPAVTNPVVSEPAGSDDMAAECASPTGPSSPLDEAASKLREAQEYLRLLDEAYALHDTEAMKLQQKREFASKAVCGARLELRVQAGELIPEHELRRGRLG